MKGKNVTNSIQHAFDESIQRERKMLMLPFSLIYNETMPEPNFGTANPIKPDNSFDDSIRHAAERLILES